MDRCKSCGACLPSFGHRLDGCARHFCNSDCIERYLEKETANVAVALEELKHLATARQQMELVDE